jgi:uncharacterized repeat protein (TIGR03803 family)
VLHAFTGGNDGGSLWGSLLLDGRGNVYGTTNYGGAHGGGTVFELVSRANGTWTLALLYNFCSQTGCQDGNASTAGLIFDTAGNLYGTTGLGGAYEYGTVFELTSQSGRAWEQTVLHSFDKQDGVTTPYAGVVMDPSGNLFGTGAGWAYELSPGSNGWTLTGLHSFTGENGDGSAPIAGVLLDPAGNLYGTTEHGGGSKSCGGGCGTVYQLHPIPDGSWKEHILHRFQARWDGAFPGVGALVLDRVGNLYGTADGGNSRYGVIFRLSPGADGRWRETVLYNIPGGTGGESPGAGVVRDKAGNLFGTTIAGGDPKCGCGLIFKLAPQANGKWKYIVLHRFTGYDGAQPDANLVIDSKGNLYGTTAIGGAGGYGVAFELTP